MKKPNFFIVGAPKCGTTALFTYLGEHPDIYIPETSETVESQLGGKKELHFFGHDLGFNRPSLDNYLGYYTNADGEQQLGESSVFYLYSQQAAEEIKAFNPDARILVMLRNPIDMMYSWYSQLSFWGDETLPTFQAALEAEADRKGGKLRPAQADHPIECFYYREIAQYTDQVKRYFDLFGRDRVHVIIFDDFKQDTAAVYQRVTKFLGCNQVYEPDFRVINSNKSIRNKGLQGFLRHPPKWVRLLTDVLIPVPVRRIVRQRLQQYNTQASTRNDLDTGLRRYLQQEFKVEIEHLSQLLDRDLTHWVQ
ncbi:MAG: sulfotransferase [Thermosynechococcaceae cyanobacterium]